MGSRSEEYYGSNTRRHAETAPTNAAGSRPGGSRGTVTSRPSRDSILQSYAAQDAERARNARMYSQAVSQVYQENSSRANDRAAQRAQLEQRRREREAELAVQRAALEASRAAEREADARRGGAAAGASGQGGVPVRPRVRVVPPLSSQESYDRTRSSMESYERARASRDALSASRAGRSTNREVIDARGSIDSRAFNEQGELVGYTTDERDKPRAAVDDSFTQTRWHSRAGQGFSDVPDSGARRRGGAAPRGEGVGFSGGVMSGRAQYAAPKGGIRGAFASLPLFVKIAIPVIVALVIVLVVLVTR
ncbi:MAG: hypothetical protein Q4C41_00490 [Eggerthellaceae bacterium]|nr:hypothetical protein [Eggerthellaceae bacterium]